MTIVTLTPVDLDDPSAGLTPYELERRLGHRSRRYIQRYTNPPEAVAASYVEEF